MQNEVSMAEGHKPESEERIHVELGALHDRLERLHSSLNMLDKRTGTVRRVTDSAEPNEPGLADTSAISAVAVRLLEAQRMVTAADDRVRFIIDTLEC